MKRKRAFSIFLMGCLLIAMLGATPAANGAAHAETLASPVLERFSAHPLGLPLTIKWATVIGAASYTASISPLGGQSVEGVVVNTTATFSADMMPVAGKYQVTVVAKAGDGTTTMVSRTFEVLPAMPSMMLAGVASHTAGNDLTVRWFSVTGASSYVAVLTPPAGAGDPMELTVDTASATFPGKAFSEAGVYSVTVRTVADGFYPSAATITFPVEKKRFAFGIGGDDSAGGEAAVREGTVETAAYKAAFGAAETRAAAYAYTEGLTPTGDQTSMDILKGALMPILPPGDAILYGASDEAYFSDYTACQVAILVDIACGSNIVKASEIVQISAKAVGDILQMMLEDGAGMDPAARKAVAAYREKCKSAASASLFDEVPSLRRDIVALVMSRVTARDDAALALVTAVLEPLLGTEHEPLIVRSLDAHRALAAYYAAQIDEKLAALPDTTTWAELEALNGLYQRFMLCVAHLSNMAETFGGAEDAGAHLTDALRDFSEVQAQYIKLTV